MMSEIRHLAADRRLELWVEGQRCKLDYRLDGALMTITHTNVPQSLGGRGLAAQLTAAAFELARAAGWKVRPACSYAAVYAQRHPELAELLA